MTTNTFAYNGFGARVSKTDIGGSTTYLRSGTSVVAPVVSVSGAESATFTPGERTYRPDNEAIEGVRQDAVEELEEQYLLGPLEPIHPSIEIGSNLYQIIDDLWEMLGGGSIPDTIPIGRVGIALPRTLAER